MADEPTVDDAQEKSSMDKWKPALKAGLALIAVWVVTFIFVVIIKVILSAYLRPLWVSWWEYDTGRYPIYSAIYVLLSGILMLALAGILVAKKGWHAAFFDELQLNLSRKAMNYFIIGLIIGAVGILALSLVTDLSDTYLFKSLTFVGFMPEKFAVAVLLIVPLLVLSIGEVALIQGYFQRTISKNYGWVAGLFVAAFIFLLLRDFPHLIAFIDAPLIFTGDFMIGVLIAYLFMRYRSLYLSIGFIFAWYLFSYIYVGFVSVGWITTIPTVQGLSMDMVTYVLQMVIPFLILMIAWHIGDKSPDELEELKGKLKNAVDFFRFHEDEN